MAEVTLVVTFRSSVTLVPLVFLLRFHNGVGVRPVVTDNVINQLHQLWYCGHMNFSMLVFLIVFFCFLVSLSVLW